MKNVFIVDDSTTNLAIAKNALSDKYNVFTMPSAEKLMSLLQKIQPDLVLLDVEMPQMSGYDAIRLMKANPATAAIPVIFLTAKNDTESELQGLSLGAIDYITKPFSPPLLIKRIEVHLLVEEQKKQLKGFNDNLMQMVNEKTNAVVALQNAILKTIAELVEFRDVITGAHIERTQKYLKILVDELIRQGIYKDEIESWDIHIFLQSSQLHDVGKIAIKDSILQKKGKLTAKEFEIMKTHTTFGYEIINKLSNDAIDVNFLEHARILTLTHHEWWDGSGYPKGLKGEQIPLQGRLMAVADVYDALISERSYKKSMTHREAKAIMSAGKGIHFEPCLITVFEQIADKFNEVVQQS